MLDYYKIYQSGGVVKTKTKPKGESVNEIKTRIKNLEPAGNEMDLLFDSLGYNSASDWLIDIFGQETHYGSPVSGYNPSDTHSMGLGQVDPIAYWTLINDIASYPGWESKAKIINSYMQAKPGYKDWDISKLATVDVQPKILVPYAPGTLLDEEGKKPDQGSLYGPFAPGSTLGSHTVTSQNSDFKYTSISPYIKDPLTNFILSRLVLAKDTEQALPKTKAEGAHLWNTRWNRNPLAGDEKDYLDKVKQFRAP